LSVFVLDTNKKPQNPIHPAKARLLLTEGKAAVFRQFLSRKPGLLKRIQKQSGMPLKDAGAVNTTRCDLFRTLKKIGLPLETGSGGLIKFNRTIRGLYKTHWLDAACVGKSTPEKMFQIDKTVLIVKADSHGSSILSQKQRTIISVTLKFLKKEASMNDITNRY
jgi:hypothetical protein